MKLYILLVCFPLLTGCITLNAKPDFPEAPEPLLSKCDELETINKPSVLLSELMKTVARNYGRYHECSAQMDAWLEWYKEQRKNALKN